MAGRERLSARRTHAAVGDGLTLADLCNHYLTAKSALVDAGELRLKTFGEYRDDCEMLVGKLGRTFPGRDVAAGRPRKSRRCSMRRSNRCGP
jgi:hypothetical protein